MAEFRVIVTGSRDWTDRVRLWSELESLFNEIGAKRPVGRRSGRDGNFVIVHGACPSGADAHAAQWASRWMSKIPVVEDRHPADWNKHGKAAGPIRNCEMASAGADLCLAFWDGKSKGTRHMIEAAVQCGIPVRIVPAKGGRP